MLNMYSQRVHCYNIGTVPTSIIEKQSNGDTTAVEKLEHKEGIAKYHKFYDLLHI